MVNKKLKDESAKQSGAYEAPHTPEANEEMDEQDEASVHKKIKISKEFPRPEGQDDCHVYSVVNKSFKKKENQLSKMKHLKHQKSCIHLKVKMIAMFILW